MKTIRFKSIPSNYQKEITIKNNTTRFTDDWTNERWKRYNEATHIIIANRDNPKEKFKRKIIDKTKYKNIVVITYEIIKVKD